MRPTQAIAIEELHDGLCERRCVRARNTFTHDNWRFFLGFTGRLLK